MDETRSSDYCMEAFNSPPQVSGSGTRSEMADFKCVLVVIDLPASAKEILRYARMFVREFDAQISVLHVIELRVNPIGSGVLVSNPGIMQSMNDNRRRELKELVASLWESNVEAKLVVRQGRPDEVIVGEARCVGASLIIMTLPNGDWLSRLRRRDTARRVIQNSPCPVLVIRTGIVRR